MAEAGMSPARRRWLTGAVAVGATDSNSSGAQLEWPVQTRSLVAVGAVD